MSNDKVDGHKEPVDFALMDVLVERNPELNDKQLLALYQKHMEQGSHNTVQLLTGKITDQANQLLTEATQQKVPDQAFSHASYRIGRRLQSGGQSDVFLAHRDDQTFHKTVVIKRLQHAIVTDIDQQRLLQEMQILADLKHVNIVNILDAGIDETQHPWMILEHINGQHFDDYIRTKKPSQNDIINLCIDIAQALHYVHQQGVFHLDIKPSNILIESSEQGIRPVLIDFGIAIAATETNTIDNSFAMATPAFAAPEQLRGSYDQLDQVSDIFSFGKLLKHLLYVSKTVSDADLNAIIDCCCEHNKNNRYADMSLLIDDLNRYLTSRPVSVRTLSWLQRWNKNIIRNKRTYSVIVAMIMLLTSVLIYFLYEQKHIRAINQHYWQQAQSITSDASLLFAKPTQNIEQPYAQLQNRYQQLATQLTTEKAVIDRMPMAQAASSLGHHLDANHYLQHTLNLRNDTDVLLALAKNHLHLYHQFSHEISKHAEPELQSAQLLALNQKWIEPAVQWLQQVQQQRPQDSVIRGLLLYYQGQHQEALSALSQAQLNNYWPVEQLMLSASILKDAAQQALNDGNKAALIEHVTKSVEALQKAHDIARSDPLIALQWCQIESFSASVDLHLADSIAGGCTLLSHLLTSDAGAIAISAEAMSADS